MTTNTSNFKLKPFLFNGTDISFLLSQVTFRPLFDANGVPIVGWDGTTVIYDINGKLLYDPAHPADYSVTGNIGVTDPLIFAANAVAFFGSSYDSTTDASGLRNVSGLMNNLISGQSHWGQADLPFMRMIPADFQDYLKTYAVGESGATYGNLFETAEYAYDLTRHYVPTSVRVMHTDYTTLQNPDGTINQQSVVDYTPRMISLDTTTGGVTYLTDGNGKIIFQNGLAQVTDWGMLDATTGSGQIDYQNPNGVTVKVDASGHAMKLSLIHI